MFKNQKGQIAGDQLHRICGHRPVRTLCRHGDDHREQPGVRLGMHEAAKIGRINQIAFSFKDGVIDAKNELVYFG